MTDPDVESAAWNELQCYTLAHGDPRFIHQHVVDAWMAQHADELTKPIGLAFALIGLHLHVDRGRTGRQVQRAHMALARGRLEWPSFALPSERGSVTAIQVLGAPAGPARDEAIEAWCASVWAAYHGSRAQVAGLISAAGLDC